MHTLGGWPQHQRSQVPVVLCRAPVATTELFGLGMSSSPPNQDSLDEAKEFIVEELKFVRSGDGDECDANRRNRSPNVLKIRELVKSNPSILANSSAEFRCEVWALFLLGPRVSIHSVHGHIGPPQSVCKELHVLQADVTRTRGDIDDFRSEQWKECLSNLLQHFCTSHDIQYKQGMNEILAPFIYLRPPPSEEQLTYDLFEAFLFRYLARYFCVDDSSYLFKAFRLFHILLMYHDPQLAIHLDENHFPPELYAPSWFMTLYSRALPVNHVLRLWDILLATDDPAFNFFIGLSLVRRHREAFLMAEQEKIPEIIQGMKMEETEIDTIVAEAIDMYKKTPRCYCRSIRLCCVTTPELTPLPYKKGTPIVTSIDRWREQTKTMCTQAARQAIMLTPRDLVTFMTSNIPELEKSSVSSSSSSLVQPMNFVVIDVRSAEDVEIGGILPRAVRLDPDVLENEDLVFRWIQHFDGTKGCHICIVDMPPVQTSEVALWRRLLLGEGDGFGPQTIKYSSLVKDGLASLQHKNLDEESVFAEDEKAAALDDNSRPGVQLAYLLCRHGFPYVSVMEGGFPSLIEQLPHILHGAVEPIVLDHDPDVWENFLNASGRKAATEKAKEKERLRIEEATKSDAMLKKEERKLTREEELKIGLKTAAKLNHKYMHFMIASRLKGENALIYTEERPQLDDDESGSDALNLGSPQKFGTDSITL